MTKRRYLPPQETIPNLQDLYALPTHRPIAIYYRQSQQRQVGNTSTALQIEDLPAYLKRLGWAPEDILLIDDDAAVSEMKAIHERTGMSRLFDLIVTGQVGAVACHDEDRLFRDMTQIQVNLFIQACYQADVRVVTPQMVYDFAGPNGWLHARQFRYQAELAAEFIVCK